MSRPGRLGPLLIFDLDGTLYRTDSSFLSTMHHVYDDFGIPRPTDREIMSMVGEPFGRFLDWLIDQGFPPPASELGEVIAQRELVAIRNHGRLFRGVRETLARLRDRGCILTLCTNGDRRYATEVLGACGILGLLDRLQTLDEAALDKSKMIAELRRDFPDRCCVMVGDRYHDVEAGRANGCVVVGAAYGYSREGELASADYVIDAFPQLERVLESACP
jgi:phosphoglycolate phosphatase